MKKVLCLLLVVFAVVAQERPPINEIYQMDTLWIDSTESEYSRIFWCGDYQNLAVVVTANDTGVAGFGGDSACVTIETRQVFDIGKKNILLLKSPDADSLLWDSLRVQDMDSTAAKARKTSSEFDLASALTGTHASDTIGAAVTGYGASAYKSFSLDYAPGVVLKVTGKANNRKRSIGSQWVVRFYAQRGQPVRGK
jgi:hypothetical protein